VGVCVRVQKLATVRTGLFLQNRRRFWPTIEFTCSRRRQACSRKQLSPSRLLARISPTSSSPCRLRIRKSLTGLGCRRKGNWETVQFKGLPIWRAKDQLRLDHNHYQRPSGRPVPHLADLAPLLQLHLVLRRATESPQDWHHLKHPLLHLLLGAKYRRTSLRALGVSTQTYKAHRLRSR